MTLLGMQLPHMHTGRTRAGGALGGKAKGLIAEKGCLWFLLYTQADPESNRAALSAELGTKGAVGAGLGSAVGEKLHPAQGCQLSPRTGPGVLPAWAGTGAGQCWPCSTRMLLALSLAQPGSLWGREAAPRAAVCRTRLCAVHWICTASL